MSSALTSVGTTSSFQANSADPIDRYFELSLFGLLTTGFLTLASTGRMDLFTLLVMGLALAARGVLLLRQESYTLSLTWETRLTIAYIPFFFIDLVFLLNYAAGIFERVLLATVHMLFFTAVIKLFSARQSRDYAYLAALAFAQMLAAATMTIGTSFLFFFALFLLLAICTFTSFEIRRARERASGPRTALPGASRMHLGMSLSAVAAVICLSILVLTVILFFVIPRGGRSYFSPLSRPTDRMTGFSDDVELSQVGQIQRSSVVVMHIDAPDLAPGDGIKWRGVGLTTFDGKRWYNPGLTSVAVPGGRNFRFREGPLHPGQPPQLLQYSVTLEPMASDVLFLASQPLSAEGSFRTLWEDEAGSIYVPAEAGSLLRYAAESDIAVPSPALLRQASGPIPERVRETYLQLPAVDPRVTALAQQLAGSQPTAYDKAISIERYLQSNYGYTLDLPAGAPVDPIAYFLFDAKRGHCEFFASAMAVMLRALQVPARVVNGFQQGQLNDYSGRYTVRGSDAHTWVEVYFPVYGWVAFDPTPAGGTEADTLLTGRMGLYLDAMETFWEEWVINYDFLHQATLARQVERASMQMRADSQNYFQRRYRELETTMRDRGAAWMRHRTALLILALLIVAAFIAIFGRSLLASLRAESAMRRRTRQGKSRPQDATLLYMRLLRFLARRGLRKAPGQTPAEFAESVAGPMQPLVRRFTELYQESRFGPAHGSLAPLDALLREIQSQTRGAA